MKRLASVAIVLLAALPAVATEVIVELAPVSGAGPCAGSIVAVSAQGVIVRERVVLTQSVSRVALTPEQSWTVSLDSEGCWSETAGWSAETGNTVRLPVHRAATVAGTLRSSESFPPAQLSALVFPVPPANGASSDQVGHPTGCKLVYPDLSCRVPAGLELDLRIDVPGYASLNYWGISASPGTVSQQEPRRLIAGGSVAGWVEDSQRKPIAAAKVRLTPLMGDASRTNAASASAVTNKRGYFQIAGLDPGTYRLRSEAEGLSDAQIAEIRVAAGEALIWPRRITHVPMATLNLTLDPPVDPAGDRWTVELSEGRPLLPDAEPLVRSATKEGVWNAGKLRADLYRLKVSSAAGSVLERLDLDLSEGGQRELTLTVRSVRVTGVVRIGDEPLETDLELTNFTGKFVNVRTAVDGTFETFLPSAGEWKPILRYPSARGGSAIELDPVTVSDAAVPTHLELKVPGGRVRGEVVDLAGKAHKAAVHVVRSGRPIAQRITDDDGHFDLIGLSSGTYGVDAQGKAGTTPHPVVVELKENDAVDVRLVLEPNRIVEGTVFTPNGLRASGATVYYSSDAGRTRRKVVANMQGRFEISLPGGTSDVHLVVLTYEYPASLLTVAAAGGRPIDITLAPAGSLLRVRGAGSSAYVRSGPSVMSIYAFYYPEPRGRFDGAVYLAPGRYLICPSATSSDCKPVILGVGGEEVVVFEEAKERAR